MHNIYPSYLEAYNNGQLSEITDKLFKSLESCSLCPRNCRVNRLKNKLGLCKTGQKARVYSFLPHHGEEPPISGENGSGTIFFSNCSMGCVYCQNYEFSQQGKGREVEPAELADFMLKLQDLSCHNLNLVTPTHNLPQILKALCIAIPKGLKIPIAYNTNGYELADIIKLLAGIVDIYLPDMRYADKDVGLKYSAVLDYPKHNQEAIKEMYQQVGIAKFDNQGIIIKGLIIRHLVLPQNLSGTEEIMRFISTSLTPDSYISLMSQYFPCYKADQFREISRRITQEEYEMAKNILDKYGLYNGWTQEPGGNPRFAGTNIKPI